MRDEDRNASGAGMPDIETALKRLETAAAPPGLRRRVLDRAREACGNVVLPSGMRIAAVACSVLIIIVMGLGPLLERDESARLAARLDSRPRAGRGACAASELAEVLAVDGREAGRLARLQALAAAAGREKGNVDLIETYKSLKGWLDYETPEDPD